MAKKNNIRSIRFSDELAELIDRQAGDSFTEKFENLITRCVWELPQKEKELEQIVKRISTEKQQLEKLCNKTKKLNQSIKYIEKLHQDLEQCMKNALLDTHM